MKQKTSPGFCRWVAPIAVLWAAGLSGCGAEQARTDATRLYCSFAQGQWDPDQWIMVKSPRWGHCGKWVQKESWIENAVPSDASNKELIGKLAGETYTSMVMKAKRSGSVRLRSTMEFADRMAPLIVIAPELGADKNGYPEYREHFEVVLFDKGVNVWHHQYSQGKASWEKMGNCRFSVEPGKKHELTVTLKHESKGKQLIVTVGQFSLTVMSEALPDSYYVGFTGCEGVNRFYDFRVEQIE